VAGYFDGAGNLTEMLVGDTHHLQYEYNGAFVTNFEKPPYQLRLVDEEQLAFANAMLPKRLEVNNLSEGTSEVMVFQSRWGIGAYIPEAGKKSRARSMRVMTDGSFRLFDGDGAEEKRKDHLTGSAPRRGCLYAS